MNRATCHYRGAQNAHCSAAPVGTTHIGGVPVGFCAAHEPKLPPLTRRPKGQCWVDGCWSTTKPNLCHIHRPMFARHGVLCSALEETMPEEPIMPDPAQPTGHKFTTPGGVIIASIDGSGDRATGHDRTVVPPSDEAVFDGAFRRLIAEGEAAKSVADVSLDPQDDTFESVTIGDTIHVRRRPVVVEDAAALPPIREPLDPGIADVVELLRVEGLATVDSGDGRTKKEAIEAGEARDYPHVAIQVNQGLSARDVVEAAKAIPWAKYGYRTPFVERLTRTPESAADEPEMVGVYWPRGHMKLPEATPVVQIFNRASGRRLDDPSVADPESVGATARAEVAEQKLAEIATKQSTLYTAEQVQGVVAGALSGFLPWKEVIDTIEKAAPGAEPMEALRSITGVPAALKALKDRDRARKEREEMAEELAGARAELQQKRVDNKNLLVDNKNLLDELFEVCRVLTILGAPGGRTARDALMQVLSLEDRRAVLGLEAAEAAVNLARVKAHRLVPASADVVALYEARAAAAQAALNELPAGEEG